MLYNFCKVTRKCYRPTNQSRRIRDRVEVIITNYYIKFENKIKNFKFMRFKLFNKATQNPIMKKA